MNGDQVRDTWFCPASGINGYDAAEVDDLVRHVASELDAARPAGPVVANAQLWVRGRGRRYDVDAVDWFLGQFLLPPGQSARTGSSDDPWHDLPVTQLALGREGNFASRCEQAWHDFGQLHGTRLRWELARKYEFMELWTAERQKLASMSRWLPTFSVGEKSFTLQHPSAGISPSPDVAELPDPFAPYNFGRPAKTARIGAILTDSPVPNRSVRALVDETGTPILYISGNNYNWRACAGIRFPDHRWLRFLVRGTGRRHAIMTAVDQAGNRVARYRFVDKSGRQERFWSWGAGSWSVVETIVHPDRKLTDELALTLAISADWLGSYFNSPSGGG